MLRKKHTQLGRAALVGALATALFGLSPAPVSAAEADPVIDITALGGSFSSYISGWAPSSSPQSRVWYDSDTGSTSVRLTGCSTNGPGGFQNVTLQLVRTTGINTVIGERTNRCAPSTSTWQISRSGDYAFGSTEINGYNYYNGTWSANAVVVTY
ncbi:hypothetical protein [Nocardiopsis sp. FR4]|nr:hypothetical protein [Nocardiopsis sp. FR4]